MAIAPSPAHPGPELMAGQQVHRITQPTHKQALSKVVVPEQSMNQPFATKIVLDMNGHEKQDSTTRPTKPVLSLFKRLDTPIKISMYHYMSSGYASGLARLLVVAYIVIEYQRFRSHGLSRNELAGREGELVELDLELLLRKNVWANQYLSLVASEKTSSTIKDRRS